ncbi:MAG: cupin domain-containing protein [Candidatus Hydrothermae bacterium]|nr:cupin domain-containing protein [Candidatus Hydrothermae bacterium]
MLKKVNLLESAGSVQKAWVPLQLLQVGDVALRLAWLEGEYRWHLHPNEDEFFLVLKGKIVIETRDESVSLGELEGALVPKGTPHRSKSEGKALVLLIEPITTNTYGVPYEE